MNLQGLSDHDPASCSSSQVLSHWPAVLHDFRCRHARSAQEDCRSAHRHGRRVVIAILEQRAAVAEGASLSLQVPAGTGPGSLVAVEEPDERSPPPPPGGLRVGHAFRVRLHDVREARRRSGSKPSNLIRLVRELEENALRPPSQRVAPMRDRVHFDARR
jgi:hypothetical protein